MKPARLKIEYNLKDKPSIFVLQFIYQSYYNSLTC